MSRTLCIDCLIFSFVNIAFHWSITKTVRRLDIDSAPEIASSWISKSLPYFQHDITAMLVKLTLPALLLLQQFAFGIDPHECTAKRPEQSSVQLNCIFLSE